jgi:aryl-alcohol dehydrogenase-like predicted oxidoreductase
MAYGIANRTGQPRSDEVQKMLQLGREHGVQFLDTAYAYGEAEKVLGAQRVVARGYQIVTKTRPLLVQQVGDEHARSVTIGFQESLASLACQHVYGLLVHGPDVLLVEGGERIWAALEEIKSEGRVRKIGVSVYHPRQLERVLDRYPIELVQLPFSVYDQRFKEQGLLCRLQRMRIEVDARSVFLQGLLLLSPDRLPPRFESLETRHAELHDWLRQRRLTAVEACLLYCLQQPEINRIIVGCETAAQLKDVLEASATNTAVELSELSRFGLQDEAMIDPSTWQN